VWCPDELVHRDHPLETAVIKLAASRAKVAGLQDTATTVSSVDAANASASRAAITSSEAEGRAFEYVAFPKIDQIMPESLAEPDMRSGRCIARADIYKPHVCPPLWGWDGSPRANDARTYPGAFEGSMQRAELGAHAIAGRRKGQEDQLAPKRAIPSPRAPSRSTDNSTV